MVSLAIGCHRGSPSQRPGSPAGWPVVLDGAAPTRTDALLGVADGVLIVGGGDQGVTVGGRSLSEVPGAFVVSVDRRGRAQWVRTLESDASVRIEAVAAGPQGDVLLTGFFSGQVRSGVFTLDSEGSSDCLFGRMDPQGRLRWLTSAGGAGVDLCRGIAVSDDGAWVVGSYEGEWHHGFEGTARGGSDVMVLQVDLHDGSVGAGLDFGGRGDDHGRAIAIGPGHEIVVGGAFGGPFDAAGAVVVSAPDRVVQLSPAVTLTPSAGDGPTDHADYDGFVVTLGPEGRARWGHVIASPGFDTVKHIVAWDGGWAVSGVRQPDAPPAGGPGLASDVPLRGFVDTLGPQGQPRWSYDDPGLSSVGALAPTPEGLVFAGHVWRSAPGVSAAVRGPTAAVVVQLDPQGAVTGSFVCDGDGQDLGVAIAVGPGAELVWGGEVTAGSDCAPDVSGPTGFAVRLERTNSGFRAPPPL